MSASASNEMALKMVKRSIASVVSIGMADLEKESQRAQCLLTTICESQDVDGESHDPTKTMEEIDELLQKLKDQVVIVKTTLKCATYVTTEYRDEWKELSPSSRDAAKRKRLEKIEQVMGEVSANPVDYMNRADVGNKKTMDPGTVTRTVIGTRGVKIDPGKEKITINVESEEDTHNGTASG